MATLLQSQITKYTIKTKLLTFTLKINNTKPEVATSAKPKHNKQPNQTITEQTNNTNQTITTTNNHQTSKQNKTYKSKNAKLSNTINPTNK